ncbi:MAG TPA: hypothetical protein VGP91_11660 [Actinoplanes sp.]|nr:hypothetical protein [Actinoplanes sp.]
MADQQPGGNTPAAGLPDDSKPVVDPTRLEPDGPEASTVNAPVRWSASAAVPASGPKRAWWSRRRTAAAPDGSALDPAPADVTQWAATPAVDPWAGQDTPWDPMPAVPEVLPPTQVDRPPVASLPPAAAPPTAPPRRGWRRKKPPTAPANRLPVAPRPVAPPPRARPLPPPAWRLPPGPPARRPLPPPPAWRPPPGPQAQRPLPPPARRRRWPRRLALFTLFSVACCCGVPAAYAAWPPARQYPVTAILPDSVGDLKLRDDSASRRAVQRLTEQLKDRNAKADQVFAGVYADGNGKRVTIFGTTGLHLTPGADVDAELRHLTGQYDIRDVKPFDLGESGAHERCGVGNASGTSVVVCAWADHGSLATVLLTRRSVADSAELTGILRSAVLTRK